MKVVKVIRFEECAMPDCDKMFKKTRVNKVYCSQTCAKRASRKRIYTKNYKKRKTIKLVCKNRDCGKDFRSSHYAAKYCSRECNDQERLLRERDKRRKDGKAEYLGKMGTQKMEYINPKFSSKWMQDLWDKRKEKERV